jgi:autotransporter strand-loop-strand O-heptosyltransferase
MFIGIGSGLSWLSWGLGVKTVLISGFSYDWAEMRDCIRISPPKGKCEGCFNRLRLDAGDWNWCPDHKGTQRQFECTKSITSEMVIKELEKVL